MIFAQFEYAEHYAEVHESLVSCLEDRFARVEEGLQGDSYIWIWLDGEKVAVDTFTAMKHEVKSERPGPHVVRVLDALKEHWTLRVYPEPESEAHESD